MTEKSEEEILDILNKHIEGKSRVGYEYNHDLLLADNELFFIENFNNEYRTHCLNLALKQDNDMLRLLNIRLLNNTSKRHTDNSENKISLYNQYIKSLIQEWKNEIEVDIGLTQLSTIIDREKIEENIEKAYVERSKKNFSEVQTNDELEQLLDDCIEIDKTVKETFDEQLRNIYDHLDKNELLEISQSEKFVKTQKTQEGLAQFIGEKQKQEHQIGQLNMSKSQKFQKAIIFDDWSIAILTPEDKWESPSYTKKEYCNIAKSIAEQYIEYKCRKKPKYTSIFKEGLEKSGYHISNTFQALNTFLNNEQVIKATSDDYFKHLKNIINESEKSYFAQKVGVFDRTLSYPAFENISDWVDDTVYQHKVNKLAQSIVSNKYAHLYDQNSFQYFERLHELNISKEKLQENIGQKMASLKNSDSFNNALKRYCNSLDDFKMESYLAKIEGNEADIVFKNEDHLIVKINTFEASQILGSPSWCLSQHQHYFKGYTSDNKEQFFIYDFSKSPKEKDSMMGITIQKNDDSPLINAMHYKNDTPVDNGKTKNNWFEKIAEHYKPLQQNKTNKKIKP